MNKKRSKEIDADILILETSVSELEKPIEELQEKISELEKEKARIQSGMNAGDVFSDGKITILITGYSNGYYKYPIGLFVKKDGTVGKRKVRVWNSERSNWKKSDLKIKK